MPSQSVVAGGALVAESPPPIRMCGGAPALETAPFHGASSGPCAARHGYAVTRALCPAKAPFLSAPETPTLALSAYVGFALYPTATPEPSPRDIDQRSQRPCPHPAPIGGRLCLRAAWARDAQ